MTSPLTAAGMIQGEHQDSGRTKPSQAYAVAAQAQAKREKSN
jgi:hypothetical protein